MDKYKLCPTDKQGCGIVLPLNQFASRWRMREDGKKKIYECRCRSCEKLRVKLRDLNKDDQNSLVARNKKRPATNSGPKKGSAEHIFLCGVKPCLI